MESERTEQKTELKGDNVVIGLDCDTPLSVVDKSVVRYHSSFYLQQGPSMMWNFMKYSALLALSLSFLR